MSATVVDDFQLRVCYRRISTNQPWQCFFKCSVYYTRSLSDWCFPSVQETAHASYSAVNVLTFILIPCKSEPSRNESPATKCCSRNIFPLIFSAFYLFISSTHATNENKYQQIIRLRWPKLNPRSLFCSSVQQKKTNEESKSPLPDARNHTSVFCSYRCDSCLLLRMKKKKVFTG